MPKTIARASGTVTNNCDASGNITQTVEADGTRTAIYDSTNRPLFINRGHNARFVYGPDGSRVTEELNNSAGSRILTRGPAGSEREAAASTPNLATYRHELGDAVVTMQQQSSGGSAASTYAVHYRLHDRLGSPLAMLDASGNVTSSNSLSFDAFGAARNRDFTPRASVPVPGETNLPMTHLGFTGHEHLKDLGLIHMNGRAYDYQQGRFVSVDPFIQFPMNSQSLNPYSYVLNNPLSGTDPTGYLSDFRESAPIEQCRKGPFALACGGYTGEQLFGPSIRGNGSDKQGSKGAESAPPSGAADEIGRRSEAPPVAEDQRSAGEFLLPYTTELGERGIEGTWADYMAGLAKFTHNSALGLSQMSNPIGMSQVLLGWGPRPYKVSDRELSGASSGEVATLVVGPVLRAVSFLRSAGTILGSAGAARGLAGVPGRVRSRINLSNEGMEHVIRRHLSGKANASQFSLSEAELRSVLSSRAAVGSPVVRSVESADGIRYVREFDAGRAIGADKFNGNQATSVMTIMTDRFGNLVSTFPGLLK